VEAPETSAEGYRIVWYRSSEKWRRDERARDHAIQTARQELERSRARVGRRNLKTREQVQTAVDAILDETKAPPWVVVELAATERHAHRQAGPGRPGKNTRYVRRTTIVHEPVVTLDQVKISASAAADGIFPLITNASALDCAGAGEEQVREGVPHDAESELVPGLVLTEEVDDLHRLAPFVLRVVKPGEKGHLPSPFLPRRLSQSTGSTRSPETRSILPWCPRW
jgi:hypothetical protein